MMDEKSVKTVLEAVGYLENIVLIENGSLDSCMKEIGEQKGGFIGTHLTGPAGSLLPALFIYSTVRFYALLEDWSH